LVRDFCHGLPGPGRQASEACSLELLLQPDWARLQALKQALLACSLDLRSG